MPEVNDIQKNTDVEQAKAKLQEVAETKEGRKDPRAGENTLIDRKKTVTDGEKAITPVTGKPMKKKFSRKFKEAMFGEDIGNGGISEFLFFKLLIPTTKKLLAEMANTAINMVLGLDPKTRTIGTNTHVANANLYRDRNYNRPADGRTYNWRNAISEYEWDEETVKDIYEKIVDLIETYGMCSLADAYSICGLCEKIRTTDSKWGWTSVRGIDIYPVDAMRERWIIDLPSARPLP